MKTMIIFSDTHGHREGIERLMPLFSENDYVIHLGDGAGDMREVVNAFPEKVFVCQGNCDFVPALSEGELEVEGVKIFFCHGHRYRVKSELSSLAEEARRRVLLVNPGSLRRPAGEGGGYCYLTVEGEKVYPVLVGESVY